MKKAQLKRWRDFSLRMAATTFKITPQRKVKLLRELKGMFSMVGSNGKYKEHWNPENWRTLSSWDDYYNGTCFCDWFDEFFDEYNHWDEKNCIMRDTKFSSMLHCCVRAGLDMAAKQSAGVVGFTKGDIEKMYPRGVPGWIQGQWESGPLFGEEGVPIEWDAIGKNQHLWL